ncbi:unnamed protein product [Pleuronectes platessa]|uniref:Uncharacterized protein n=1 Tax=Pleuronectes platessa TaxID=8262 RepID=A0A9N7UHT4_PLEPL|nr:unnamed protein product [Pleuronectes platessa]
MHPLPLNSVTPDSKLRRLSGPTDFDFDLRPKCGETLGVHVRTRLQCEDTGSLFGTNKSQRDFGPIRHHANGAYAPQMLLWQVQLLFCRSTGCEVPDPSGRLFYLIPLVGSRALLGQVHLLLLRLSLGKPKKPADAAELTYIVYNFGASKCHREAAQYRRRGERDRGEKEAEGQRE